MTQLSMFLYACIEISFPNHTQLPRIDFGLATDLVLGVVWGWVLMVTIRKVQFQNELGANPLAGSES